MENKSFHVHHSAFGAFSSFIMGKMGKGGGFVLSDVRPPEENLFIGYKQNKKIRLLPFCTINGNSVEQEFTGEIADTKSEISMELFSEEQVSREMGWASDTWRAENFKFSLLTPFGSIKEPLSMSKEEKKYALAPVIFAQITLDNTKETTEAEMIFGIEGLKRRLSQTTENKYLGAAFNRSCGFGVENSSDIRELSRLDILTSWGSGNYQNHDLGRAPSLLFKVPAGTVKSYTIALATYQHGKITTGIDTEFYYTEVFGSLEEVIDFAIKNKEYYLNMASERDKELEKSGLNAHRKFLVSHATHSYHASSQLMKKSDGKPLWIVNEGEYIMINTFDLTIDHIFWEMKFHPWTIVNTLNLFVERYSYYDQAGLAFTHDMGVANGFSPKGYSAYELPNLEDCFSYMTHEELLNWILTGAVYAIKMEDREWLGKNSKVFEECFQSLMARDGNNDGIMDVDSSRCEKGSEITTYDSLDISLGQSRNNLYLGMKSWSAYILLNMIFREGGHVVRAQEALEKAELAANTIVSKFDEKEGYIPAVFEKGNGSRIIPAVEALIYPYIAGNLDAVSETGAFKELIFTLKKHVKTVLKIGCCIDEISGGWKLSSTSQNTWASKIFLCQYVIKEILNINFEEEIEKEWDKVHAAWQQISCSEECATDQLNSDTGSARGSRLYPRLVTNILWLK